VRLLLVDRLTDIVPWRSARGIKLVSAAEDFIQVDSAGGYMPRGLVLECAFQAAAWLIVISSSMKRRPAVVSVLDVHWFGHARPGDRLDTEVHILQHDDQVAEVSGEVTAGSRKILKIDSGLCTLMPTSELDTPGATEWMIEQITGYKPERLPCVGSL
jgi:3-hydroxymyristoyl/3-hydroxydecanoyl-(acyl carrier protein) dehydratase